VQGFAGIAAATTPFDRFEFFKKFPALEELTFFLNCLETNLTLFSYLFFDPETLKGNKHFSLI